MKTLSIHRPLQSMLILMPSAISFSDPFLRGELAALVGVEDFRQSPGAGSHGVGKSAQAQPGVARIETLIEQHLSVA